MKRSIIVLLTAFFTLGSAALISQDQKADNDNDVTQSLPERKLQEAKTLDGLRESKADSTEYTLDPTSVELLVEMDPNGYGFRSRNYRMTITSDIDLILRGRLMLQYNFRFFPYFSLGLLTGIDWSDLSILGRIREQLAKPSPWQFSVLGGVSGRLRVTEWYMRSAFFFEPSIICGHMWQSLPSQKTKHWTVRPGLFGGMETVFDSGFAFVTRAGVEFPVYFNARNPIRDIVEPLLIFGLGFAL